LQPHDYALLTSGTRAGCELGQENPRKTEEILYGLAVGALLNLATGENIQ
jgi:hypothetical protein